MGIMKTGNKAMSIITGIAIFLAGVDFYLTYSLKDLVPYLESNPIYPYFGLTGIVIINLLFFFIFWLWYDKTDNVKTRFAILNSVLTLAVIRIFVIINNWKVVQNPPSIEVAMQVTQQMKQQAVASIVAPFLIPFIIGLVSFLVYSYDHKIFKREK